MNAEKTKRMMVKKKHIDFYPYLAYNRETMEAVSFIEYFSIIKLRGHVNIPIRFLGHYRPELGKPPLWQLDSDNHLQVRHSELNLFGNCK